MIQRGSSDTAAKSAEWDLVSNNDDAVCLECFARNQTTVDAAPDQQSVGADHAQQDCCLNGRFVSVMEVQMARVAKQHQ